MDNKKTHIRDSIYNSYINNQYLVNDKSQSTCYPKYSWCIGLKRLFASIAEIKLRLPKIIVVLFVIWLSWTSDFCNKVWRLLIAPRSGQVLMSFICLKFQSEQPWVLKKTDQKHLSVVLHTALVMSDFHEHNLEKWQKKCKRQRPRLYLYLLDWLCKAVFLKAHVGANFFLPKANKYMSK